MPGGRPKQFTAEQIEERQKAQAKIKWRVFYSKNRDILLASNRKWYQANKEKVKERRKTKKREHKHRLLVYMYGITIDQFESMVKSQFGCCKICGNKPNKSLAVDHCHSSGIIRGLLCNSCNTMLGHAKDRVDILESAAKYLMESRRDL